jgi:uncharacterized protein YjbJ (UPF0337 family)
MAEPQPRREGTQTTAQDPWAGQWDQLRGQLRAWWDRLTEADLARVAGQKDQLVRVLQERYGYTRERAAQEVDRRLREYTERAKTGGASGLAETVTTTAQEAASSLAGAAGAVGAKAAAAVTDTVKGTGSYLQERGVAQLPGDLAGLVRRYPVPALLLGLGVGFLLGRSLGRAWTAPEATAGRQASAGAAEAGYPEAVIQCVRCGQMVRQAEMVQHSTTCSGPGLPGHGGSPT